MFSQGEIKLESQTRVSKKAEWRNEKLENKSYPDKCDFGTTNNPTGYKYGTMAEKYLVEHYSDWNQAAIYNRGKEILTFMQKEWGIRVSQKDSRRVLGLPESER